MNLEDMRLFARVAETGGFTAAARAEGLSKQTVSRRVAALETALGVQLLHRTTRRVRLTEVGAAYAERCAEIIRLAEEADRAVTDAHQVAKGTLRVTAAPLFGEAFLDDLVVEYARRSPDVRVEVMLTRRRVDLVEEGFDLAFRVDHAADPGLVATRLGPARILYCASPEYLARRGVPAGPENLAAHDCITVTTGSTPVRWPFSGTTVAVHGRLRLSSQGMAQAAALAGLGIALFPEFACTEDVAAGRLVPVLDPVDVGAVWLVHPASRYLAARVRTFVDLAKERFVPSPPWATDQDSDA